MYTLLYLFMRRRQSPFERSLGLLRQIELRLGVAQSLERNQQRALHLPAGILSSRVPTGIERRVPTGIGGTSTGIRIVPTGIGGTPTGIRIVPRTPPGISNGAGGEPFIPAGPPAR